MAHQLVELSDTKSITNERLVIIDYGGGSPLLCRSGIWVGWETEFVETVVLSYEHDPDELYVGWMLNGTVVSQPGFPPSIFPPGFPVPGDATVRYMTPVDNLYHRISLTGQAGMDETCVYAEVLYATFQDIAHGRPATHGPGMSVCLRGKEIAWPADKLAQERECLQHLRERLHKVAGPKHVNPGDPVEQWLARLQGEDVVRMKGLVQALEQLDPAANPRIVEAARTELRAMLDRLRMQGRIAQLGADHSKSHS